MDDVLAFWFTDPKAWWQKDPAFDAEVHRRFAAPHAEVVAGAHEGWRTTPRGALAYVIVLDQLSRNMFRDTPQSFAHDAQALAATRAALAADHDARLSPDEARFLTMPLMHSEALADQDEAVARFTKLGGSSAEFAERHRVIIRRFGRFPHRNAILGRPSTAEELAFLETPGSSF